MRALLALVIGMGVLIFIGTGVVAVTIMKRMGGSPSPVLAQEATLHEPAGTHIATISPAGDRLAVLLQGGGPDRILFLDRTGAIAARVALAP